MTATETRPYTTEICHCCAASYRPKQGELLCRDCAGAHYCSTHRFFYLPDQGCDECAYEG